jgi:heme O synthase-like polyprenyltransferase
VIFSQDLKGSEAKPEVSDAGRSLERNNLILALLGTLASVYFQDRAMTLSFAAGGALTVLNLRLWRLMVRTLTSPKRISRGKLIAQVIVKFAGGLGALAVIMLVFHPQPIAFLLGLSTVVLAVILEAVLGVFRES